MKKRTNKKIVYWEVLLWKMNGLGNSTHAFHGIEQNEDSVYSSKENDESDIESGKFKFLNKKKTGIYTVVQLFFFLLKFVEFFNFWTFIYLNIFCSLLDFELNQPCCRSKFTTLLKILIFNSPSISKVVFYNHVWINNNIFRKFSIEKLNSS